MNFNHLVTIPKPSNHLLTHAIFIVESVTGNMESVTGNMESVTGNTKSVTGNMESVTGNACGAKKSPQEK